MSGKARLLVLQCIYDLRVHLGSQKRNIRTDQREGSAEWRIGAQPSMNLQFKIDINTFAALPD